MRELIFIAWIVGGLLVGGARAETFRLTDSRVLTGDLVSPDEHGVVVRPSDGNYTDAERIPWAKFSQDDLKKMRQNPRAAPFVEPFIELTPEEKLQEKTIVIKDVPRLQRPAPRSLISGMSSSGLGAVVLLLLFLANLYAAYEISIFRSRPAALVCGVAAVVPVIGPLVFLCIPAHAPKAAEATWGGPPEEPAPTPAAVAAVEEQAAEPASHGLTLAARQAPPAAAAPETQTFQRGQYTFNRRFFETKFPGFFGIVRRDAEKDMVLVVKSARGSYVAQRITRISANEVHLQVQKGLASEEVMVPFLEIQEAQLKHKDA